MNNGDEKPDKCEKDEHKSGSRTWAKRVFNAQMGTIHAVTSGDKRKLAEAQADIKHLHEMLTNACAVLEAVVRRHGTQIFDRQVVESVCAKGQISWIVTDGRIGVKLREESDTAEKAH